MADFAPFSLGNVLSTTEGIKGQRLQNALREETLASQPQVRLDAEQEQARGLLAQGAASVAQSSSPRRAYEQWISSPDFQSATQKLQIPPGGFTLEATDTDQSLASEAQDFAIRLGGGGQQGLPAGTREFNALTQAAGLGPEGIQEAAGMALGTIPRAGTQVGGRIVNVPQPDGTSRQMILDPTGMNLIDLPTTGTQLAPDAGVERAPEDIAAATTAATAQAQTEALPERARVEAEIKDFQAAPTRLRAAQDIVQTVIQLTPVFDRVLENTGAFTVGFLSSVSPPGSPAADMKADLQTLGANAAFGRLQEMRDSSPTGGALGQVSERELALLTSAVAAIEQSQSPEQFRSNVIRLRANYKRIDNLAKQAQRIDRIKSRILSLQNRPQTPELQNTVSGLRQQIFDIEDELFATINEVGVAAQPEVTDEQNSVPTTATGPNGEKLILINGEWVQQ